MYATAITLRNNPATDDVHERKLRKKPSGRMRMTINTGRMKPNSIRIMPRVRRKRGDLILVDTASRPQNVREQVQSPGVPFHHIDLQLFLRSADENDSPSAG